MIYYCSFLTLTFSMKSKTRKMTANAFSSGKKWGTPVLGELQASIMEVLWQQPDLTVSEVEQRLQKNRDIAHTTVLTILDRMHQKGLLRREKHGKAFVYAPQFTKEEFERGVAQEVIGALLSRSSDLALSAFVDLISEDGSKLDQLESLIVKKKGEKKRASAI